MASKNEITKKLEQIIQELNPEELKHMIQKLTEDYYLGFFSNNKDVNEASLNNLKQIAKYYSADFNVNSYINYCFLLAVNRFLEKYVHNEIKLKAVEVDLVKKESNSKEDTSIDTLEMIRQVDEELAELYEDPSSTIHDRTEVILKAVDKQLELEEDNRLFKGELANFNKDYDLDKILEEITVISEDVNVTDKRNRLLAYKKIINNEIDKKLEDLPEDVPEEDVED